MESGSDAGGREVVPQPALGHHEQIHGVGEQDVLEPVERRRRLGATERDHDVRIAHPQPGLRVIDAEQPRREAELLLKGRAALRLAEIGQGTCLAKKPGTVAVAERLPAAHKSS